MAINTRSNIRTETNVAGEVVDNDALVEAKAHAEHTAQLHSDNPWSQSYQPAEDKALQNLYAKQVQIEEDPSLAKANKQDLKIRNLNR